MSTGETLVLEETIEGDWEIDVVKVEGGVVEWNVVATEDLPTMTEPAEPEEEDVDPKVVVIKTVVGRCEVTKEVCVEASPVVNG